MNTILVIGANGFSGRNFIDYVKKVRGYKIIGFSKEISSPFDIQYFQGSVVNYKDVNNLIKGTKPDYIINLSGSFSNEYSKDFKVNVSGSKNILDSVIENNLVKVKTLFIGSSAEYGEYRSYPFSECHPLEPASIYALTKAFQTKLVNYYHKIHKLNISLVRPSNLIGPKMSNKLFIGNFFEQALKVTLSKLNYITIGNENDYRDYIDIRDAVKVYYDILISDESSVYNLGTGRVIQIKSIVDIALNKLGIPRNKVKNNMNSLNHDINYHAININKLKENMKYKPFYTIEESIENIITETKYE